MGKKAKKSKGKKVKASKVKKQIKAPTKNIETTPNGNPTKIWCQFYATQDDKHRINKARAIRGHKTLGDYAMSLVVKDLKELGSKVK